jgi:hypothetical protein
LYAPLTRIPMPNVEATADNVGAASVGTAVSRAGSRWTSKHPPAKPGALSLGPLKGAQFPNFDDLRIQTCCRTLDYDVGDTPTFVTTSHQCRIKERASKGSRSS